MKATLNDLTWMCGAWRGYLDPEKSQSIEEKWSEPAGGTMSTMVRLTSEQDTIMIELIAIREVDESLILHLRQFSPALEPRLSQDMPLLELSDDVVAFSTTEESHIPKLAYRKTGPDTMEVDVTLSDGNVLTGGLQRA